MWINVMNNVTCDFIVSWHMLSCLHLLPGYKIKQNYGVKRGQKMAHVGFSTE